MFFLFAFFSFILNLRVSTNFQVNFEQTTNIRTAIILHLSHIQNWINLIAFEWTRSIRSIIFIPCDDTHFIHNMCNNFCSNTVFGTQNFDSPFQQFYFSTKKKLLNFSWNSFNKTNNAFETIIIITTFKVFYNLSW